MDIDEIKTLTDLMVSNDLSEIMLRDGEKRIILRRGQLQRVVAPTVAPAPVMQAAAAPMAVAPATPAKPADDPGLAKITSPMVGTYYASSSPEAQPFVKIGDRVNNDSVVCIIEAMKVFNEIKAEVSGVIESIEVTAGTPVEYGQVLMKVRTA
ncbi:MAG: acetyl-CoA carboxylase biotin carboxyl carrier protein [Planctomycetes bacterium]|nr:acetyl-CoA carboxylase biotin carboxyl carrier protein [Planctomycetota bacterium]